VNPALRAAAKRKHSLLFTFLSGNGAPEKV